MPIKTVQLGSLTPDADWIEHQVWLGNKISEKLFYLERILVLNSDYEINISNCEFILNPDIGQVFDCKSRKMTYINSCYFRGNGANLIGYKNA